MKELIILAFFIACMAASATLSDVAMSQPGVDMSYCHLDNHSYMVAIQPSTSATPDQLNNAIRVIAVEFGKQANESSV
jgi:hypothetical protein